VRLIERVWFNNDVAKWWLVPLLLPLAALFWLITTIRRYCYKKGFFQSISLQVPVVVVGNIGIGGNGKTPLTIFLIELCQSMNIKVGVVSRGYGGKPPYTPYLINDESSAIEAGDEPLMIYQRCRVPIAVGSDRIKSIALLKEKGCLLVLADDGLQHYRMARSKELVVVDGNRQFGNGLLLPAGPLRETKARLETADMVVVNGQAQLVTQQVNMTLKPVMFINMHTKEQLNIKAFADTFDNVNAIAAIGDPSRFFNTLNQCNIALNSAKGFVDHHQFSPKDLQHLSSQLPLVMTEKDAVKCQAFAQPNWWYLAVSADFSEQINDKFRHMILQCLNE